MSTVSERTAAKIAGIGYLIIFVLAIFANFAVFEAYYVPGDAAATSTNIQENQGMFRLGILSFLIVTMIDIIIAWALYIIFAKRNKALSALAATFRAANAILFAVAVNFMAQALSAANTGAASQALASLDSFHMTWMIALFGFGIHLILIAALLFRHTKVQTTLAVLLTLAGLAYMIDTTALILLTNYEVFAAQMLTFVAVPGVIGELGFTIWILWKGFGKTT